MKKNVLKWFLPMVLVLNACSKDDSPPPAPQVQPAKGVYVLSEGLYGKNNTKLGLYSFATSSYSGDFFLQQNPTVTSGLGDTGNDMVIYGSKLYIVMNVSSKVFVLNASSGKLIDSVSFGIKQPRYAAAANGKLFVTAYDGTVNVIDTSSLTIIKSINVGSTPEGIVKSGDNLYISNSGGFDYPTFDSTVSVVNITSLTETQKIKVGKNPGRITADNDGNVYVALTGDYGNTNNNPAKLVKINTATNLVTKTADTTSGSILFYNNLLYVTGGYYGIAKVRTLSPVDFSLVSGNVVTDGTVITNPYGVNINDENGDIYIMDAKDNITSGAVTCFDKNGVKKFSFSTTPGVSPNKVVFSR